METAAPSVVKVLPKVALLALRPAITQTTIAVATPTATTPPIMPPTPLVPLLTSVTPSGVAFVGISLVVLSREVIIPGVVLGKEVGISVVVPDREVGISVVVLGREVVVVVVLGREVVVVLGREVGIVVAEVGAIGKRVQYYVSLEGRICSYRSL